RVSVGQKDLKKPNETVLLVGETGAGKSTLVNYSMGVKFEDEVWFQIVEEEESQTESQTSDVTVYQVFDGQTLPFSLTVIDTPGFGNSRGISWDVTIRGRLLELFPIHAVGLVVKASDNRLSDRLMYIYDSVMSLFGKTCSDLKTPEHVLQTLQAAGIRCAKDGKNRPVHFLLDAKQTLQREPAERAAALRYSWGFSYRQMDHLTQYLTTSKPQNLATTVEVLGDRIRLTACTQNLKEKIQLMELKQTEIRQTEEAVRSHEEEMRRSQSFTVEVDEEYNERRHLDGGAVSCCHCDKTCHCPCTVTWYPATCEVKRNGHCSVCYCHSSAHVKREWVYQSRTRRVQKILEDVKRRYEFSQGGWMKKRNLLQNLEKEKEKL
uniref:Septin-type G domain-containing protein n=1 Tax=Poecilia formosa TaxID=48698 RepID=A0A096M511_POEFO